MASLNFKDAQEVSSVMFQTPVSVPSTKLVEASHVIIGAPKYNDVKKAMLTPEGIYMQIENEKNKATFFMFVPAANIKLAILKV